MRENETEEMEEQKHISERQIFRGGIALLITVFINSLGVVLMLYSGAGISAISSVPYAFSEVLPHLSLGTWTYIFQGILVASLMIMRKKFVPTYLFSFVVGFVFSELLDMHELWTADHSDGPFPKGAGRYYGRQLSEDQNRI